MDTLPQNVGDLPAPARSAVEGLMGHALRDDQQVYIVALDAIAEPPDQQRRQASVDLQQIMNEMHERVRQSGVSPADAERTIDEACDEVRYGR
jgi:hypothetical protein